MENTVFEVFHMHATLTKKISLKLEIGDLMRLFRVLGSFENNEFEPEIIKSDAIVLLEELKDIREVMGVAPSVFKARIEVETEYGHSSNKITLGDLLVPGEKLPDVAIEEYEKAPPLID